MSLDARTNTLQNGLAKCLTTFELSPVTLLLIALSIALAPATALSQSAVFPLDGKQQVPEVSSPYSGSCAAVISDDETTLQLNCTHNVPGAIAAHIHRAPRGVNGPVLFPFAAAASPINDTITITEADLADLLVGNFYVNVHSPGNPNGEIRGQVTVVPPVDLFSIRFSGDGSQQVPPVTTTHSVQCHATSTATYQVEVVCVHDVADAIAAHIHGAAAGANGGVLFDFGGGASPLRGTWSPTPEQVEDLFTGGLYVNVHSPANQNGEVRAQIAGCFAGVAGLCLNRGRFSVTLDWEDQFGNEGFGHAVPQSDDAGLFWFFSADNLELQIKVLNACGFPGAPRYWVFFSATTNQGFELTVRDTKTNQERVYTNPLGQPAQPILDTDAFATCP